MAEKREHFQMIPDSVLYDPGLTSYDIRVYGCLAGKVRPGVPFANVGIRLIASSTSMAISTVQESLKRLASASHIKVCKREKGERAGYLLTSQIFTYTQGILAQNLDKEG